jgi:hypothetical protein
LVELRFIMASRKKNLSVSQADNYKMEFAVVSRFRIFVFSIRHSKFSVILIFEIIFLFLNYDYSSFFFENGWFVVFSEAVCWQLGFRCVRSTNDENQLLPMYLIYLKTNCYELRINLIFFKFAVRVVAYYNVLYNTFRPLSLCLLTLN